MLRIAAIYYSSPGHVCQLAVAVQQGAESAGAKVRLPRAAEFAPEVAIDSQDAWHLRHELVPDDSTDAPLVAQSEDVTDAHALRGLAGVRAYAGRPLASAALLARLGFSDGRFGGSEHHGAYGYDAPPAQQGGPAAGTARGVASSVVDDAELELLRQLRAEAGARPTPIIDRQYVHSVYFPSRPACCSSLRRAASPSTSTSRSTSSARLRLLPPRHEHRRDELELTLTRRPV